MSPRVRAIVVFLLVVVAAGAGLYVWQREVRRREAEAVSIRQEVLGRGTIIGTVNATGNLDPQQQANLYFDTAAPQPVAAVYVEMGQVVTAGMVLARLQDSDLALSVTEAEQALRSAELRLRTLQAPPRAEDVALAEANLRVAKNQQYAASLGKTPQEVEIARLNLVMAQTALSSTYAAMARLESQGKYSEKQALQAQADRQVEDARIAELRYQQAQEPTPYGPVAAAQAAVEQAQAALDRLKRGPSEEDVAIARRQISQARAALEIARHGAAGTTVTAPFEGVVAAVNIRAGEPAVAARPAIVLVDLQRYYLDVLVDEVDVARVAVGQPVTVTLDALPDVALTAAVEKIAPVASVNAGIVSYPVRLSLVPPGGATGRVRAGMTATAAIVVTEARDVVLVPNWAIRRDRDTGRAYVGVLADGVLRDVAVELGLHDDAYSEARSGVQAGDVVGVATARPAFSLFGTR
jgi:HlyD family secretion protein